MNFGEALAVIKGGGSVARSGWNGKRMHVYLEDGYSMKVGGGAFKGRVQEIEPVLVLFNAQQKHQPGWVPSQPDMLADDWMEVEPR